MKYCSGECCKIETNTRQKQQYHERAAIKRGKKRICSKCNITQLSRYNESPVCDACVMKAKTNYDGQIDSLLQNITFA